MKAIIMAGGEGKRLRPLTAASPKPLVKIAGEAVMTHILRLLKRHGITEAAVTTGYLGHMIEDYFGEEAEGVRLQYFTESKPLGSAGGVKAAWNGMKDPGDNVLVISGDAVCDLDLSAAYEFHVSKKSSATLLLSRVSDPAEYGIVMCDSEGKITGFLEKPPLSQIFTDTVNTGIYILTKDIMERIPNEGFSDFGRNIFPMLLSENYPLYGISVPGSWCDIGDLSTYYESNMSFTEGMNIYSEGCLVSPGAFCEGSVVCSGAVIEAGAQAINSVLLDGAVLKSGAKVVSAVIGENCTVNKNASVGEGSVIGGKSTVGEGASVMPGTVLPYETNVPSGIILRANILFKSVKEVSKLFTDDGISAPDGMFNTSFTVRIGQAFAAISEHGTIGVMKLEGRRENRVAASLCRGISMGGADLLMLGNGFESAASDAAIRLELDYVLFVREQNGYINIGIFDRDGLYPHRAFERAFSAELSSEPDVPVETPSAVRQINYIEEYYLPNLTENRARLDGMSLSVRYENPPSIVLMRAFMKLGASLTSRYPSFSVDDDGVGVTLSDISYTADRPHLIGALLSSYKNNPASRRIISLPVTLPEHVKSLCPDALTYSRCPVDSREDDARRAARFNRFVSDGIVAALDAAELLHTSGLHLSSLCSSTSFNITEDVYRTDSESKLAVMRKLGVPSGEGVILEFAGGGVRIIPQRRGYILTAEAADGEYAEEIISFTKKKIARLLGE